MAVIVAVWFIWGGALDLKELFRRLKSLKRDDSDDGTVVGHHNVADEEVVETTENLGRGKKF